MQRGRNLNPGSDHNRIEPYRDYWKRDKLCRELEREYGLQVDNGVEQKKENRLSDRTASMEAFSGQQSFASYCLEKKPAIKEKVERAHNWQQLHQIFTQGICKNIPRDHYDRYESLSLYFDYMLREVGRMLEFQTGILEHTFKLESLVNQSLNILPLGVEEQRQEAAEECRRLEQEVGIQVVCRPASVD